MTSNQVHDTGFPAATEGLPAACRPSRSSRSPTATRTTCASGVTNQLGDHRVRMLLYNGTIPGPPGVTRGSEISVRVRNDGDHRGHGPLARVAPRQRLRRGPPRDPGTDPGGRRVHLPAPFPDDGVYWYHPHVREDYGLGMGLGNILVDPRTTPGHRRTARRSSPSTTSSSRADASRVPRPVPAMGRFGNVMPAATPSSSRRRRATSFGSSSPTPRTPASSTSRSPGAHEARRRRQRPSSTSSGSTACSSPSEAPLSSTSSLRLPAPTPSSIDPWWDTCSAPSRSPTPGAAPALLDDFNTLRNAALAAEMTGWRTSSSARRTRRWSSLPPCRCSTATPRRRPSLRVPDASGSHGPGPSPVRSAA